MIRGTVCQKIYRGENPRKNLDGTLGASACLADSGVDTSAKERLAKSKETTHYPTKTIETSGGASNDAPLFFIQKKKEGMISYLPNQTPKHDNSFPSRESR